MTADAKPAKGLREKLGAPAEERLGRALTELLENPLLTGAVARAFEARERATQAQEVALGALNIPSASDIERLTRRLRSVSQRLEGIEDGVDRLDRSVAPRSVDARLAAIEQQLATIARRLDQLAPAQPAKAAAKGAARTPKPGKAAKTAGKGAKGKAGRRKASGS
ncbi:MAG TPA: hypothetical protein VMA83_08895 [Solirubrobacteraceae bacterium]|nr:hypothetical protein [Solirubrobacteraceae bacterium]